MKRYVVGFIIGNELGAVLLLRKRLGSINGGMWNGVGGEVRAGESPDMCMRREGVEEAGGGAANLAWHGYAIVHWPDCDLHFYWATAGRAGVKAIHEGDEPTRWVDMDIAAGVRRAVSGLDLVPDVPEMLAMAVREARSHRPGAPASGRRPVRLYKRPVEALDAEDGPPASLYCPVCVSKMKCLVKGCPDCPLGSGSGPHPFEPDKEGRFCATCGRTEGSVYHDKVGYVVEEHIRETLEHGYHGGQVRPAYYGGPDDPYEAVKVIRAWGLGFCLGSVLKYVRRAGSKGLATRRGDLLKARTYIDLELAGDEK